MAHQLSDQYAFRPVPPPLHWLCYTRRDHNRPSSLMLPSSRWTLPKHSTPSDTQRSHVNSPSSTFRMLYTTLSSASSRTARTWRAMPAGHLKLLTSMPASCRVPILVHHPSTWWLPTYTPSTRPTPLSSMRMTHTWLCSRPLDPRFPLSWNTSHHGSR